MKNKVLKRLSTDDFGRAVEDQKWILRKKRATLKTVFFKSASIPLLMFFVVGNIIHPNHTV
jgi:hypothetical protein